MPRLTTTQQGYGQQHQLRRQMLAPMVLAGGVQCARCGEAIRPGEPWDLGHVDGDRSRYAGPEHARCNRATAGRNRFLAELEPERPGLGASDRRWRVPWLRGLRRPPADATWPRLMTVPHPRASGSLGGEFAGWAEERSGRPLRWWQQLVAARALEVDVDGELVWGTVVLTVARQLGKSWLLRELLMWRIHQGDRFGEPQTVLHTGKDVAVVKEVQRDARLWAKHRPGAYKVSDVNGQESIEWKTDGSRWLLKARGAVYGYSANMAAVDEAWKVDPEIVDAGLSPTMVERAGSQLWLVSTAHRMATPLMIRERRVAVEDLEDGREDTLILEWSAPPGADLDDVGGWRAASPHWTAKREKLVRRKLEGALANEVLDAEESDAVEAFRAQWLNQWPRLSVSMGEHLLPDGLWQQLAEPVVSTGPIFVAVEDDFGLGAAVAAAARRDDGRIEVDASKFDFWDQAVEWVGALVEGWQVRRLLMGASMVDRMPPGMAPRPVPVTSATLRPALALFRDLALNGGLVHDVDTPDLDHAVQAAKVREQLTGLTLAGNNTAHVVKAAAWAVAAAHKPTKTPAVR